MDAPLVHGATPKMLNRPPFDHSPPPPYQQPISPQPARHHRIPRPPIPRLPLSIRHWLVGRRSLFFIGLMLMRVIWVCLDTVRKVRDPRFAVIGGAIFLMSLVIASPDRRLRAPAVGVLCGLIWTYALSGTYTLDTPAFRGWPVLLAVVLLAGCVELAYSHVARLLHPAQDVAASATTHQLAWAAVALQTIGGWLFVGPVAFVVLSDAVNYGLGNHQLFDLVPLAVSLPPVVGVVVYLSFVIRRLRDLHADPLEA
jgi:hypothetical protein